MKKIYSAPVFDVEKFETADIITVSFVTFNNNKQDATNSIPAVDIDEKFS